MTVKRAETAKLHFTKRGVEDIAAPASGRTLIYDQRTRGLGVKVEPSGHKTFFWFRKVHGYPSWHTIGEFPDLSVEEARHRADERNAQLARWKAAGFEGPSPFDRPTAMTLDGLVGEYVERHLKDHAKRPERAEKTLKWMIERYVPALRHRTVSSIRHEEIAAVHRRIGEKHKRTANAVVKTLRTLFNFARRAKLFHGENPAKDHLFYREESRARFLQPDELPKLWQALRRAKNPDLRDFVNLSLWCGARRSDTLSMRWQDVSLADNRWTVPDPKSRTPYTIPLTPEAVDILRERLSHAEHDEKKTGIARSPFVFPSHGKSGHVMDLKKAWRATLKDAELDYVDQPELRLRIHDLRRTAGSWMAGTGASMVVIGKSLGHADPGATKIYARLDLGPVREAMITSQAAMLSAMKKRLPKPAPRLLPAAKVKKASHG